VVQRDEGASAQEALGRALRRLGGEKSLPGPVASGHLDVARRLRLGMAEAGVLMEPAARAYRLAFAPLELHTVELWVSEVWQDLPAVRMFLEVLASSALLHRVEAVGGYDLAACGLERTAS
jgi:molybdate-binding protein